MPGPKLPSAECARRLEVPGIGFDGSNLSHAAIDQEFDSIDEAALVGSEEQDSLAISSGTPTRPSGITVVWEAMKPVICSSVRPSWS